MGKKAVLFLVTGFEEAEALVTVDILRRGGIEVTTVSLTGSKMVTGSHDISVEADALFNEIKGEYDALILPGGPGTARYNESGPLLEFIKKSSQNPNIVLAAICAAPSVLGNLGLLEGKRATCYPGFEDKLKGADVTTNPYEADGRIITGRSAGSVFDFSLALLKELAGDEIYNKVKDAVIWFR